MKYLFIGDMVPSNIFAEVANVSPSTNNVELAYVDMLSDEFGDDFQAITKCLKLRNKACQQKRIEECVYSTDKGNTFISVGFCANTCLSNISSMMALYRKIKQFMHIYRNESVTLIVNNPFYGLTLPAFLAKRHKDLFITIINEGLDVRYLREHKIGLRDHIYNLIHKYILRRNSGIITFCETTVSEYAPKVPFLLLIHSCDCSMFSEKPNTLESSKKSILYAGLLSPCYGIPNIVEAVGLLPEKYHLTICGNGDEKIVSYIQQASQADSRIHYVGMISRNEVVKLEQKSDILLLIRVSITKSEQYIAKYCQPSKLPEYMMSGTPILATDIEGIPSCLKEYLVMTGAKPEEIATKILEICEVEKETAKRKAERAMFFAKEMCSVKKQKEDISNFIKKVVNDNEKHK